MANDANETLVAQQARIYVAPAEETLPTGVGAPSGNFVDLGYTTTDGFSFSNEETIEDIDAHQDYEPIRQVRTKIVRQLTFNAMQWSEEAFAMAFGGGSFSTVGTVREYDAPDAGDAIAEYTVIADIEDGDKFVRLIIPRGTVANAVETTLVNNAAAVLPITVKGLKPASGNSFIPRFDGFGGS